MSSPPKEAARPAAPFPTVVSKEPSLEAALDRDSGAGSATTPRSNVLAIPAFYTGMRSCLLCGNHRLTSQMRARRLLGRTQWVCSPACGTGAR